MNKNLSYPDGSNEFDLEKPDLSSLFAPTTVAVLGASEHPQNMGRRVLGNLLSNPFGGTVYPIHRSLKNVFGLRAYPHVSEIPDSIDLAIIARPPDVLLDDLDACNKAGVKAIALLSPIPASMGRQ